MHDWIAVSHWALVGCQWDNNRQGCAVTRFGHCPTVNIHFGMLRNTISFRPSGPLFSFTPAYPTYAAIVGVYIPQPPSLFSRCIHSKSTSQSSSSFLLKMQVLGTLILCSAGLSFAYEVPANLQEIYKSHKVHLACLSII